MRNGLLGVLVGMISVQQSERGEERFPAGLWRTAYSEAAWGTNIVRFFAEHGYLSATQDCRGRFQSEVVKARLVLFALLLATYTPADGADVVATSPQRLVLKPPKPVVVDGRLDEWAMDGTPYTITASGKDPLNDIHSNDATNPVKGDADFSGRAALAWDEQYLYVAGEMTDDHLLGVRPDSFGNQGPPGWGCDSLMVTVASFRQPMKTNSPFSPTPCLGLRYAPMGANPRGTLVPGGAAVLDKRDFYWVLTEHSKWAVAETPQGYNVEAAIPWQDLNFVARPGERLFIAFLGADVDPDEALNQVGWAYKGDAKDHPVFRLADRDDVLGDVTVSADRTPTDQPFSVRATLDALTGPAKLEAVRVLDAERGLVVEQSIGAEVPAGKTLVELREFKAGAVPKPGNYTVELTAGVGGKPGVVASAPLRMVEPQPEPPTIRNLPGEIRHMGADRVAHNAYAEHRAGFYRHGWVKSKEDYVPYIRRHVEPGLKEAARGAIKTKSPWGYVDAFRCLALHRLTQDAEFAQLARDIVDYMLDAGDLGWFKLTAVAQYRYLTWKQDPNSPFAPPRAEERYRANLHKVAAAPDKELFAESGTHNRVWHRYALLKIARQDAAEDGKPVDPRVPEYTDYHDKLIGEVGDTDDASAGYHWVFFDAAAAIYFHTGDWDAFLKHPGFRKTLSRYVEMVSPQCGENWFNAYYDDLYYTGLGLGRGVQAIRNPSWDLLVYFSPRPGRTHTVVDRYLENPYRCSPVQMRQAWSGMVRAGEEITFTSILLPHAPTFTPQDLLDPPADSKDPKRIEVLRDDDQATVVKAVNETDPSHKIRFETWVLLNDTGESVQAGPLASDATVAVVGLAPDGTIQHGAAVGGSALRFRDRDEWSTASKLQPAAVEIPDPKSKL